MKNRIKKNKISKQEERHVKTLFSGKKFMKRKIEQVLYKRNLKLHPQDFINKGEKKKFRGHAL